MDIERHAQIKQWIEGWKQAGIELERLREIELPNTSTSEALLALAGAYKSCRLHFSPLPYSGLSEQHAWFEKYRHSIEQE